MHVLLFAPPIMDHFGGPLRPIAMDATRECPPYGVYLLQAYLRSAGHGCTVGDLIADGSSSIAPYQDALDDAGLVGVAATSMSWPTALEVVRQVRERRPEVPIVVGGIHPTMFDDYVLANFPVDFVIRGEGERAITELARALEQGTGLDAVPNLSWRPAPGQLHRNPVGLQLTDDELGAAPSPDYMELPEGLYQGLSIESSRGCAFDCSFCSTSYRRSYRSLKPEVFVDKLEALGRYSHRTRSHYIHIIDDEFSMNPRRAIRITELIRERGMKPKLVYDSRATDLLFAGYVESIADFTGQFLVGAECGYDDGLARIGKGTTVDILERAARTLASYGIAGRADFSFILGLPWESIAEVRKTLTFAYHLHATYGVRLLLQWYCQIPGSRLWQEQRDELRVSEAMYNDFGFFRDIYLFRTGVRLSPSEVWQVNDTAKALQTLSTLRHPDRVMVEYGRPEPISIYFPRDVVERQSEALANLRTVAKARNRGGARPDRPAAADATPVTLPLRSFPRSTETTPSSVRQERP